MSSYNCSHRRTSMIYVYVWPCLLSQSFSSIPLLSFFSFHFRNRFSLWSNRGIMPAYTFLVSTDQVNNRRNNVTHVHKLSEHTHSMKWGVPVEEGDWSKNRPTGSHSQIRPKKKTDLLLWLALLWVLLLLIYFQWCSRRKTCINKSGLALGNGRSTSMMIIESI